MAASRVATDDAACDEIALKWESRKNNLVERELNFMLFDAADIGCAKLVSILFDSGASVEARDRAGNSPFMLAARKGHDEVMDILLSQGADPHETNLLGSNALLMAVNHNRRKIVKKLLTLKLDVNLTDSKLISPMIAAAYNGNSRIVSMLLDANANSNFIDESGKSPVIYAAGRGFLPVVKQLVNHAREHDPDFDINQRYGNDLTVLMWAAGHSNDAPAKDGLAIVEFLLSNAANPELTDNRGRNALHIAAERGHLLVVKHLLTTGMAAQSKDKQGDTALDLASSEDVRSLLSPAVSEK